MNIPIHAACLIPLFAATLAWAQPGGHPSAKEPAAPPLDWRELEKPLLRNHVQLTSRAQFVRAGEQYFSADGRWVVFQAVAPPTEGTQPDPFYAMYAARLDAFRDGTPTHLAGVTRVSPPGSANTCGWFHPTQPWRILMGSTLTRPEDDQKSGFQVGARKYVWMFPKEMEIVETFFAPAWDAHAKPDAARPDLASAPATPLFSRPNYDAECSWDASGRFVLYAHIEDELAMGRPDANLYIYDSKTGKDYPIITAPGYDGGPFFSPDNRSICYRSDRKGDDLLQLFVATLKFEKDADGVDVPVGIEREFQITDNGQVNWAPYWHPSGNFLVYGSSEEGHQNYEIFAVEVNKDQLAAAAKDTVAATVPVAARRQRVTFSDGADVLPVFSPDGRWMMWTSQRGPKAEGEARPSSQIWIAEWTGGASLSKEK